MFTDEWNKAREEQIARELYDSVPRCTQCGKEIPSEGFLEVPPDCIALMDDGDMFATCSPECKKILEDQEGA